MKRASGKAVKGSIKTGAKPGANKMRFTGRIAKKNLKPGKYRLTVSATPLTGGAAVVAKMSFRVVR